MKRNPAKKVARYCLQHAAARLGPQSRKHRSPQLLVLMYHRILPKEDQRARFEEPGMMVTPESFSLHLEILKRRFSLVQLSEWIERKQNGSQLPPMACAITFDDGWADNYEFAYPLLQKHSTPATIFMVSGMTGTTYSFWPERLARLIISLTGKPHQFQSHPALTWVRELCKTDQVHEVSHTTDGLSQIISRAKVLTDMEINSRLDCIGQELGLNDNETMASLLNWDQLSEMTSSGLVEPGSHTCHHTRLTAQVSGQILESEIIDSKLEIERRTGMPVKTFCYPNGDYTPRALALVKSHYSSAVTTMSGWNSTSSDNHLLHRIGIHDDVANSKTSFLSRISGWV
jgi:peptidoglycan/xylan/chitin deacetylase (PgdA/CDA1 family)